MNPYQGLKSNAFWKLAVASKHMLDIDGLWDPKFRLAPAHKVSTYGSCFAQHIGKSLKKRGYQWLITEKAPPGLGAENCRKFNYGVFTSRTGNIYTTSLLKQWLLWAFGKSTVPQEYWQVGERFYDPFRPAVEPGGFASREELEACREHTLECFRASVTDANFFVFTLGLTESWENPQFGYEYPVCPGTVAGEFDPALHVFRNQTFEDVHRDLTDSIALMREANPRLRFILTVSPVPLTATMSGRHVLVATMHSKSILRAVAGQVASECGHVDYFPSYEIINSPAFRGAFFEPNMRSVHSGGVDFVMDSFFACLDAAYGPPPQSVPAKSNRKQRDQDVVCEEELLDAFTSK